jgi:acetyl-CoA carboxylase biotin carboxyl carrier protein
LLDFDAITRILELVREHDLNELEVEHDGLRLRVRKDGLAAASAIHASQAPPGGAATASTTVESPGPGPLPAEGEAEDVELAVVKSPIVGTFYRSSEPGSPAFVEVGSRVKKGDVLCIIEAMKLMNEIDSEFDGEIANVYVENGQPVQYGERLFAIRTT